MVSGPLFFEAVLGDVVRCCWCGVSYGVRSVGPQLLESFGAIKLVRYLRFVVESAVEEDRMVVRSLCCFTVLTAREIAEIMVAIAPNSGAACISVFAKPFNKALERFRFEVALRREIFIVVSEC